ncbi:MAG: EutP/PduV family microcompartment system protein, partial [Alphaproteobacteria bacterium]|nr:EutP/PduV family microcompartment system protein [Alphaproteobacteria bacterium]
ELRAYGHGLARKPEIVTLNKCDALPPEEVEQKAALLQKACRKKVYTISAVAHQGVDEVLQLMARKIKP